MEDKICIDTDVLADFLRNKEYAVKWFKENKDKTLATTSVNMFELYFGAYKYYDSKKAFKSVNKLKENLGVLNFDDDSAKIAGEQLADLEKAGNLIEIRDIFSGSVALLNGFSMKTNNKKHFEKINGLKLA